MPRYPEPLKPSSTASRCEMATQAELDSQTAGTRRPPDNIKGGIAGWARRVSLGVGSSAVSQLIQGVQAIGLVPLFIRDWGSEGYSEWVALTALVSYLALLDLGGQSYIANALAIHNARNDEASFRTILSDGVSLFLTLGVSVQMAVVGILALFMRWNVIGIGRPFTFTEATVLGVLSANLLLVSVPAGVYGTVYRATGHFSRGAIVGSVVRLSGLAISACLLYRRVGATGFALSLFATNLAAAIATVLDTRRIIPECRQIEISFRAAVQARKHLKGSIHFWAISLAQALSQQAVILILATTSFKAAAAVYATHRMIANIPGSLRVLVQGPMLPELSYCWAHGQVTEIWNITRKSMRTLVVLTGASGAALWLLSPILYPLWTGRQFIMDPMLLALLIVQGVLLSGWQTCTWGLLAANKHSAIAGFSTANALLGIGLALFAARSHGPVGAAVGLLVADIALGVCLFPFLASSFLGVPARRVYYEMGKAFLPIVPLMILAVLLFQAQMSQALKALLIGAASIMLSAHSLLKRRATV